MIMTECLFVWSAGKLIVVAMIFEQNVINILDMKTVACGLARNCYQLFVRCATSKLYSYYERSEPA